MKPRRIAVLALTGVALAAAGGAAVAATQDDPEQTILNDAAKRLNVTPQQLRDALGAAEDAQLDKEVKAGKLTQEQADKIKERRKANGGTVLGHGRVLGGPGGGGTLHLRQGFGERGRFDHGGPASAIDAGAKALGLTEQQLFEKFRDGKSLADIAKDQGKDLADVKAAVRTAIKTDLDAAVKDKRITQDRADKILAMFDKRFDAFAKRARPAGPGPRPAGPGPGFGFGPGGPGGPGHP